MTNNGSFLENKFSAKGSLWKERVSDLEKISIIEDEIGRASCRERV